MIRNRSERERYLRSKVLAHVAVMTNFLTLYLTACRKTFSEPSRAL